MTRLVFCKFVTACMFSVLDLVEHLGEDPGRLRAWHVEDYVLDLCDLEITRPVPCRPVIMFLTQVTEKGTAMNERNWYSIENGMVHYHGFSYLRDENTFAFVELTNCYMPLEELVSYEPYFRDVALASIIEDVKQYEYAYVTEAAEELYEEYYDGNFAGTKLDLEELTVGAPNGNYWYEY